MLLGFMLSLSNRKCDLLGEPTQNLGLIVIAKDLDKDSFGTAVKRAEWQVASDMEFFFSFFFFSACVRKLSVSFTLWHLSQAQLQWRG